MANFLVSRSSIYTSYARLQKSEDTTKKQMSAHQRRIHDACSMGSSTKTDIQHSDSSAARVSTSANSSIFCTSYFAPTYTLLVNNVKYFKVTAILYTKQWKKQPTAVSGTTCKAACNATAPQPSQVQSQSLRCARAELLEQDRLGNQDACQMQ